MRLAAIFCLLLVSALHAGAADRPNILLILGDNWRFPHAGILGDPHARTPAFDRIAQEGVLFTHAFNPAPSCSPCRSSLLTGRAVHELGERASLWSGFPQDTPVVTQLLREAGYAIGYQGKPWAPGNAEASEAGTLLAGDLGCLMNMAGKLSRLGSAMEVRHVAEVLAGMTGTPAIGKISAIGKAAAKEPAT